MSSSLIPIPSSIIEIETYFLKISSTFKILILIVFEGLLNFIALSIKFKNNVDNFSASPIINC